MCLSISGMIEDSVKCRSFQLVFLKYKGIYCINHFLINFIAMITFLSNSIKHNDVIGSRILKYQLLVIFIIEYNDIV